METTTLATVLKEREEAAVHRRKTRGQEAGRRWATKDESATAGGLRRVAEYEFERCLDAKGWPGRVVERIDRDIDAKDFWEMILSPGDVEWVWEDDGNDDPSGFLVGFVEGVGRGVGRGEGQDVNGARGMEA